MCERDHHDGVSQDPEPRETSLYSLPAFNRRDFLAFGMSMASALTAKRMIGQVPSFVAGGTAARPQGDLVIRNPRALDAETPISALVDFETAPEHFFVRSHFGPPAQLPLQWTLTIDGQVRRPVEVSIDQIKKLGAETRSVTTECAGNGRGVFGLPTTSGVQWEYGAISTARWTGVPLRTLLEQAGLTSEAQHVWMEALDRAPLPGVPRFLRSIPREVALRDSLVAYAMNGRPIPLLHGGPLRLIVPGWFGMASTKWLTHIHAMPTESDNHFMSHGYRYADGSPVTTLRPKSVIASPLANQRVRASKLTVRGQAWSGSAIRAVDVSVDGGITWVAARLGTEMAGAWRSFAMAIDVRAGPALLMARATDVTGATQPMSATPNPGGYGNNSIHQVPINVT
jgi:sulfite oxidase